MWTDKAVCCFTFLTPPFVPELSVSCLCVCVMWTDAQSLLHYVKIALRLLSPHLHKAKLHICKGRFLPGTYTSERAHCNSHANTSLALMSFPLKMWGPVADIAGPVETHAILRNALSDASADLAVLPSLQQATETLFCCLLCTITFQCCSIGLMPTK